MTDTNRTITLTQVFSNGAPGYAHHFCGNSWVTRSSTTGGSPGGTTAWGVCCKCGATTEPAYRDET